MHVHVHVNEEIPKRNSKQLSQGFLNKVTGEHQSGQGLLCEEHLPLGSKN